jgi:hypothetical protein
MKTIIFLAATCIFSNHLIAGEDNPIYKKYPDKYCTTMKDNKIMVMHQGNEMMEDETLTNGCKIKPDGTLIKKDGSKMMLKDGICIDKDGKMMEDKMKSDDKMKSEEKMKSKKETK